VARIARLTQRSVVNARTGATANELEVLQDLDGDFGKREVSE
jgi:hypothetical protein